ncbi:MAG: hypothetical protein R3F56_25435 [Planctomycetota bacterium]
MTEPSSPHASRGLVVGVALVSAATLGVQVLETRLFSVMLWHHLTYMVVTITLLGFAASGSLLALLPGLGRLGGSPQVAVSVCASLFAVTLVVAFSILAQHPLDTLDIEQDRTKYFWLFVRYAYLLVPFLFAGLAIAIALSEFKRSVHRTYFWNLIGSGVGSFLFILVIQPFGGVGSLLFFAAVGGVAALTAAMGARGWLLWPARLLAAAVTAAAVVGMVQPRLAEPWLPIKPARSKALTAFETFYDSIQTYFEQENESSKRFPTYPHRDPSQRLTVWNALCRIDTVPMPRDPAQVAKDFADPSLAPRSQVHVFQDGDAPTVIWSRGTAEDRDYAAHWYGLGYHLVEHPDVLIIGPGGGNDVETALHQGARHVTAVDINGATLDLVKGPFAQYTGDIYGREDVDVVHSEGRSYLRRQGDKRFDLIVMSGTDTYAALSSGSYIFSESYLYTAEAFDDFFAHVADDGVVQVLRFRFEPPRETLKLVATAAGALQRLGIRDPRAHFVVVNQVDRQAQRFREDLIKVGNASMQPVIDSLTEFAKQPMRYGITLMRRRPFTADEVQKIKDALPALNQNQEVQHELVYDAGTGLADGSDRTPYASLLGAMADDTVDDFLRSYPYRVAPATDDRPFFFNFYDWKDVTKVRSSTDAGYAALTGSEPIGLYILAALLLQTAIITLLLVVLPLFRVPSGMPTSRLRALIYFACLGVAYLLVEITTIQRFVLYLGHPTYSLTANLAIFLVFSGLGSATAGKFGAGRRAAAVAAGLVVAMLAAHAVWLPDLLRQTLAAPEWQRVLYTCATIAPLAFCMGIPFPTGLQIVGQNAPSFLPWAFGVNGAASVLSSVLSIVLAMELGFTAVFITAAALYAMAMLTVPRSAAADSDAPEAATT